MNEDEFEIYKIDEIYKNPKAFFKKLNIFSQDKYSKLNQKETLEKIFGNKDDIALVVGNGPSAIEFKMGSEIDKKFNTILRVNNYQIKSYEQHIGTRTDIWANCVGVKTIPKNLDKNTTVLTCIGQLNFSKTFAMSGIVPKLKNINEIKNIFHLHEIQGIFRYAYGFQNNLTTGMTALILLSLFYNKSIYCIGFDFYVGKNYYFSNTKPNISRHNLSYEKKLFKYLKRKGIIKILNPTNIQEFKDIPAGTPPNIKSI